MFRMGMPELKDLLDSSSPPVGMATLLSALSGIVVAFLLSKLVSIVYLRTKRGFSYSPQFTTSLVLIAVTASFIMAVVGNSVARAFSLAGALSIVRFRNALKETEDIIAVFLAMAVGVACGSGAWLLAITSTLLICVFWLFQGGLAGTAGPRLLLVSLEVNDPPPPEREVAAQLARHSTSVTALGASSAEPGRMRLQYRVVLPRTTDLMTLTTELRKLYGSVETLALEGD
jgi:hypothetical protein